MNKLPAKGVWPLITRPIFPRSCRADKGNHSRVSLLSGVDENQGNESGPTRRNRLADLLVRNRQVPADRAEQRDFRFVVALLRVVEVMIVFAKLGFVSPVPCS